MGKCISFMLYFGLWRLGPGFWALDGAAKNRAADEMFGNQGSLCGILFVICAGY